jgi:hypothetical protein
MEIGPIRHLVTTDMMSMAMGIMTTLHVDNSMPKTITSAPAFKDQLESEIENGSPSF